MKTNTDTKKHVRGVNQTKNLLQSYFAASIMLLFYSITTAFAQQCCPDILTITNQTIGQPGGPPLYYGATQEIILNNVTVPAGADVTFQAPIITSNSPSSSNMSNLSNLKPGKARYTNIKCIDDNMINCIRANAPELYVGNLATFPTRMPGIPGDNALSNQAGNPGTYVKGQNKVVYATAFDLGSQNAFSYGYYYTRSNANFVGFPDIHDFDGAEGPISVFADKATCMIDSVIYRSHYFEKRPYSRNTLFNNGFLEGGTHPRVAVFNEGHGMSALSDQTKSYPIIIAQLFPPAIIKVNLTARKTEYDLGWKYMEPYGDATDITDLVPLNIPTIILVLGPTGAVQRCYDEDKWEGVGQICWTEYYIIEITATDCIEKTEWFPDELLDVKSTGKNSPFIPVPGALTSSKGMMDDPSADSEGLIQQGSDGARKILGNGKTQVIFYDQGFPFTSMQIAVPQGGNNTFTNQSVLPNVTTTTKDIFNTSTGDWRVLTVLDINGANTINNFQVDIDGTEPAIIAELAVDNQLAKDWQDLDPTGGWVWIDGEPYNILFYAGNITGGGGTICSGGDPGAMTANPNGGTGLYAYQWYYRDGSSCPDDITNTPISGATSQTYDPLAGLTATRSYGCKVSCLASCGVTAWTANCVTVTVNSAPADPPNPTKSSGCGAVILSRTTPPAGVTYYWQGTSCGTSTTDFNATYSASSTGTYYLKAQDNSSLCWSSSCSSVEVFSGDFKSSSSAPSSISATSNPICSGSSTSLSVVGGSLGTGASWKWYTGGCGTTLVGTGSPINVSPTSSTIYYVRAEGDCNTTGCASLTITVQSCCPNPSCSGTPAVPSTTTYQASNGSFDDGSGSGCAYSEGRDCRFVIAPSGAASISITFNYFCLGDSYDELIIFDGACNNGNYVRYTGCLSNANPYTSTQSQVCLRFITNTNGLVGDGWSINYTANAGKTSSLTNNAAKIDFPSENKDINKNAITIYPNPTLGTFVVDMEFEHKQAEVFIEIRNILGEIIQKEQLANVQKQVHKIDLSKQGAGVYFIKIAPTDEELAVRKKVIVTK